MNEKYTETSEPKCKNNEDNAHQHANHNNYKWSTRANEQPVLHEPYKDKSLIEHQQESWNATTRQQKHKHQMTNATK